MKLYKSTKGRLQEWAITSSGDTLIICFGMFGGAIQTVHEKVTVNQSGRTLEEQVKSRMEARISKQLDAGYEETIELAIANEGRNASNLLRPMLAQPYSRVKDVDHRQGFLQYKYNGHRCLITNQRGTKIAYSRNGKPINSIPHILKDIVIPVGATLDGELYVHGLSLQAISSLVRRNQDDSKKLQFICYDMILSAKYSDRLSVLQQSKFGDSTIIAPTFEGSKIKSLKDSLQESISLGYEGLILRTNNMHYEPGVRSHSLIKIKQVLDCEFVVKDVVASKDGWGILVCLLPNGSTFRVSAPGTIENKHSVIANKDLYIGKLVTIEFYEWTSDKVPFHPVAISFR
jgi:ATP-dependent DNA ligase